MSHSPARVPVRHPVLLLVVALAAPAAALGQDRAVDAEEARLQGVVVLESSYEPIEDASVVVMGTDIETRTGSLGEFAIADPPAGSIWVRVTVPGIPSVRERVELGDEGIVFLQFRMPENVSAVLDEVLIDIWNPDPTTAEAQSALDLVAAKVPSIGMRVSGDVGDNDAAVRLRGFTSLTQNGDPLIVIDDVVARGAPPLEILSHIPATDVEGIEVLRGPIAAFRYPFAANGVIHIRTKKR
jgi:outer membrane receptor protein involved in Fe transport